MPFNGYVDSLLFEFFIVRMKPPSQASAHCVGDQSFILNFP